MTGLSPVTKTMRDNRAADTLGNPAHRPEDTETPLAGPSG